MDKKITNELISQRLSDVLTALSMKQTDFCRVSGFSKSYVSNVLNGKKSIGVEMLYVLWETFKVSTNWFISGKGDMFYHGETQKTNNSVAEKDFIEYLSNREQYLQGQLEECRRMNEILTQTISIRRIKD